MREGCCGFERAPPFRLRREMGEEFLHRRTLRTAHQDEDVRKQSVDWADMISVRRLVDCVAESDGHQSDAFGNALDSESL